MRKKLLNIFNELPEKLFRQKEIIHRMKVGEAIYKSQQSAKPADASKDKKEEGKKDDNVVDADFEEVKDDNKEKSA